MFDVQREELMWGDRKLVLETGKVARQADGAVMARLGDTGQFLALVLMVLQLVSAGGTFPWQTLPTPLHPLHHALPMSYAVDGVRRLMYGGPMAPLALDVAVVGAWGAAALALGALAARRAGTWTAARVKPELAA